MVSLSAKTPSAVTAFLAGRMRRLIPAALMAVPLMAAMPGPSGAAGEDPFELIRGKWAGTGVMSFTDGTSERIVCNSQYSGTASQLGLFIGCKSNISAIALSAKLSANAGNLLGTWEEKTYKAIGSVSGKATENRIQFYIGGNVLGSMTVNYNKTTQQVTIKTTGISLKDMTITMRRQ